MRQFDNHRSRPPRSRRDRDTLPFEEVSGYGAPPPRPSFRSPQAPRSEFRQGPGAGEGREVEATVKWFKQEKGFGFVELMDGSGDAFLHGSSLARAGLDGVSPGTVLQVRVAQGQKGPQVTEVISSSGPSASGPSSSGPGGGYAPRGQASGGPRRRPDPGSAVPIEGTVKWYNATKGFGFVVPTDGSRDVFIHASTLARAGLSSLDNGQSVRLQVVEGARGPEAISVEAS